MTRRRRILNSACKVLVAGIVVNVGITIWLHEDHYQIYFDQTGFGQIEVSNHAGTSDFIVYKWFNGGANQALYWRARQSPLEAKWTDAPYWSSPPAYDLLESEYARVLEVGSGWPFIALRVSIARRADEPFHHYPVPNQPSLPGFVGNTIFFAALIAVIDLLARLLTFLAMLPRKLARKREGRCAKCAYDLTATPPGKPCPECGLLNEHSAHCPLPSRTPSQN